MDSNTLKKIINQIIPNEHISSHTDDEIIIKKDQVVIKITPVSDVEHHKSGIVDDNSHVNVEVSTPSTERCYTFYDISLSDIDNLIEYRKSKVFSDELSSTFNLE